MFVIHSGGSDISNTAKRLFFILMRYYYYWTALITLKFIKKKNVSISHYGTPVKDCLVVSNNNSPPEYIVIHLHGMGDNMWTTFKDGILEYCQNNKIQLIVPDLNGSPWCSKQVFSDLNALIEQFSSKNTKIVLSGTSMGGSIALSALTRKELKNSISGVISVSSSTKLDLLLNTSNSIELQNALARSQEKTDNLNNSLKDVSFHYALESIKQPVIVFYNKDDPVVPSQAIIDTKNACDSKKNQIMCLKLKRPMGHFRPIKKELRLAINHLIIALCG